MITVAVALATTAGVIAAGSGTANAEDARRPATAGAHGAATPAVDPLTIINIINAAYSAYKKFLQGGLSVQDATNQIITAINNAKTEIIAHIDAIATAQAKACAEEAVVDFPSFNALSADNQQLFALNATGCQTLIDSLLTTVSDKGAVDQLGFALNSLGPITLIVRARTGLSNTGVTPILVGDNQTVKTVLNPECGRIPEPGSPGEVLCESYNGDTGQGTAAAARMEAGARTSWALAKAVLPTITALP
ncbi:MAG: hypothetical protein ACJ73S_10105 [Mycobacteriales bacterium]